MIGGAVSEKIAATVVAKTVSKKVVTKSVDNIIDNPNILREMRLNEVMNLAKIDGWTVSPLGKGSLKGVPYAEGGGISIRKIGPKGEPTDSYIQWHPGGGHHGDSPYWKVSSGKSGTIRIFVEGN